MFSKCVYDSFQTSSCMSWRSSSKQNSICDALLRLHLVDNRSLFKDMLWQGNYRFSLLSANFLWRLRNMKLIKIWCPFQFLLVIVVFFSFADHWSDPRSLTWLAWKTASAQGTQRRESFSCISIVSGYFPFILYVEHAAFQS